MSGTVKEMDKLLESFSLTTKDRNRIRNIILHLRDNNKTVDDYLDYVEHYIKRTKELIAKSEKPNTLPKRLCPDCENIMHSMEVNINPATQTGDDSKIVYTCMNPNCMNQIYE